MVFCSQCGAPNQTGKFCTNCGSPIVTGTSPAPAAGAAAKPTPAPKPVAPKKPVSSASSISRTPAHRTGSSSSVRSLSGASAARSAPSVSRTAESKPKRDGVFVTEVRSVDGSSVNSGMTTGGNAANRNKEKYSYGLDAELERKKAAKYDVGREQQAAQWIADITGEPVEDFHASLKSGVLLCKLINTIKAGSVRKISTSRMAFMQRENIVAYLNACKALGMRDTDCFVTQDLFEGDNLGLVVDQLFSLSALARAKVASFNGPYLGDVRLAQENKRTFSEEQKRVYVPSRQTMGSYGYQSDSSMSSLTGLQDRSTVVGRSVHQGGTRQTQGSYGYQDTTQQPSLDRQIIRDVDRLTLEQQRR
ncbi:MAG: hypothetical protein MHM6MM_007636 [Cercozoa sp. M6MM]